jgi:spermidine/putrescine transport system substrate-binding protein
MSCSHRVDHERVGMTIDPTDPSLPRRRPRPQLHRRDVLRGGLWLSAGIGMAPLLAACGANQAATTSSGTYPIPRPDDPLKLQIVDSNPAIPDGVALEKGGVFKILNYDAYMAPGVMEDFGKKYGVEVQNTPYNNYDQMLTKISAPGVNFDLVVPGPSVLSRLVYNELIQPFNKTYLDNFKNTWAEYRDPWYDLGAQYSAPYTVYTTGVGYRADRVKSVPDNGYMMMWDPAYKGKMGILDDSGEALGMAMLAWDITNDINTADPVHINAAKDKLIEMIDLVGVKESVDEYETIANGSFTVHQAWSGDMIAGQNYLAPGDTTDVLGYWVPQASSDRTIGSDCLCIPKSSQKPALAHTFINELLDNDISLKNFVYNGYQPPLTKLNAQYLIDQGYIPENLMTTVVVPKDFATGHQFYELEPAVQNAWLTAWQEFLNGG